MTNELKLNLIVSETSGDKQNYRKGLSYYPRSGVFISTTGQIHICAFVVKFPVETKEGNDENYYINSWMETFLFTKCEIHAPFHKWISSEVIDDLCNAPLALTEKLCRQCGNLQNFERALSNDK